MLVRKYEMPWRSAYEAYAGTVWLAALAAFGYLAFRGAAPWSVLSILTIACLAAGLARWWQAVRVLIVRASLSGRAMQTITSDRLRRYRPEPTSKCSLVSASKAAYPFATAV